MSDSHRGSFEPLTPMAEAASNLHELFSTLTDSGFTEWQAIRILGIMLAEHARNQ